jgi:hypothetical protein
LGQRLDERRGIAPALDGSVDLVDDGVGVLDEQIVVSGFGVQAGGQRPDGVGLAHELRPQCADDDDVVTLFDAAPEQRGDPDLASQLVRGGTWQPVRWMIPAPCRSSPRSSDADTCSIPAKNGWISCP